MQQKCDGNMHMQHTVSKNAAPGPLRNQHATCTKRQLGCLNSDAAPDRPCACNSPHPRQMHREPQSLGALRTEAPTEICKRKAPSVHNNKQASDSIKRPREVPGWSCCGNGQGHVRGCSHARACTYMVAHLMRQHDGSRDGSKILADENLFRPSRRPASSAKTSTMQT